MIAVLKRTHRIGEKMMQVPLEVIWGTVAAFGVLTGFGFTAFSVAMKYGKENGTITEKLNNICKSVGQIAASISKIDAEFRATITTVATLGERVRHLEEEVDALRKTFSLVSNYRKDGTE